MKKNTAAWASELARKHLETPLPRRWAHTQGVARQARTLAPILGDNADLLEAAAWLHDIGYAPDLVNTGFHPLDGARYLRNTHRADDHLCRLVAHHSCAAIEARERGLADTFSKEFLPADPVLSRALTTSDMTTTPDGAPVTVEERLAEIRNRYGTSHVVTRFIQKAEPHLIDAVYRVQHEARSRSSAY
ncbi:HD domain-containing protein [Actinomadura montaniterrae]|uniref:HD domain-containing protein n=1 Tax=Actinomadura montaniterrae TaxID=1803903 RepID=A0A6L3VPD5_9ACTN|nr:HD domain-containing protein [Actinomadura montaniterrae]KAB2371007.1 HD domain-containing protein [Actinomadura montaniterrae]